MNYKCHMSSRIFLTKYSLDVPCTVTDVYHSLWITYSILKIIVIVVGHDIQYLMSFIRWFKWLFLVFLIQKKHIGKLWMQFWRNSLLFLSVISQEVTDTIHVKMETLIPNPFRKMVTRTESFACWDTSGDTEKYSITTKNVRPDMHCNISNQ